MIAATLAMVVLPALLMWCLYAVGVQYTRGAWWYLVTPVTLLALLLDAVLNYSYFAVLMWDWPRPGEHTFSTRLRRLQLDAGWRGRLARFIAHRLLDPLDPSGKHIR